MQQHSNIWSGLQYSRWKIPWPQLQFDVKDHFERSHPFGCPVYVLKDKLQGNKGKPKWSSRSRVGIFLGKSKERAKYVSYIVKLKTGNISP